MRVPLEVLKKHLAALKRNRDEPFLAALPCHFDEQVFKVNILPGKRQAFVNSRPGVYEQADKRIDSVL
ncbi:MAG: hypothetical protein V7641_1438 [Blastocatellia bacterium]